MIDNTLYKIKNTAHRFSKVLSWALSLSLAMIILIQVGVFAGIIWMNSDSGQAVIKDQIEKAAEESSYDIQLSQLSYSFPQGFKIRHLSIADKQGKFAEINDLVLRPGILKIALKHLDLSIDAQEFILYRLPEAAEEKDSGNEDFFLQPFTLPDIYFQSFALDKLNIKTLDIREKAFGTALRLSPQLGSTISLGDVIDIDLRLLNENTENAVTPSWLPDKIFIAGQINSQSLKIVLDQFSVTNEFYNISAIGEAFLINDGAIDIKTEGKIENFGLFAPDMEGKAEMSATLAGTFNKPSLISEGLISMPLLEKRGMADIKFNIADEDIKSPPLGRATMQTIYMERPVELAGDFNLDNDILSISSIEGKAPELLLNGDVKINIETLLAQGLLQLQARDLQSYSRLMDMELKGSAAADFLLLHEEGTQGVSIEATLENIVYDAMTLQEGKIKTQLADIQNPWPAQMQTHLKNFRPSSDVLFINAAATITDQKNDHYKIDLKANGKALQNFTIIGDAVLKGIRAQNVSADSIDMKVTSQGSAIFIAGQADQNSLNINMRTKDFNLASLPVSLPYQLRTVSLNANADIAGLLSGPVIQAEMDLSPINVSKEARIKVSANGRYENNLASIRISGNGAAIQELNAHAQIPLQFSLNPFVFVMPAESALDGALNLQAKAEALAALFLPVGHIIRGDLDVEGSLSGTLSTPDLKGNAHFKEGFYRFNAYGVELHNINTNAQLLRDGFKVENLTADDAHGGTLKGAGMYSFTTTNETNININLADFRLFESDKADGTLSATLELQGRSEDYLLTGDVNLGQFDIVIPERFQSTIPELNIVEKDEAQQEKDQLEPVHLDVHVLADNRIFVRGWGLDAEFGGEFNVDGTLDDPQINGELEARRGRYEEFGRRFNLDRAYLRFQGSAPPSPYLDIIATTEADDVEASVNLSGEIGNPSIKLSSVPALPEDEIMSHILFGENLQTITPFQAIQLKQTLDRFTGRGGSGFDPLGKLRDLTGFDDLRINQDDDGETSVGAGKYISEDVYLELEKGAGEDSGTAKIQVEVTPSIVLESEVGQDAQAGAGVLWRWDY